MKKNRIVVTLLLALVLALTATTALAQEVDTLSKLQEALADSQVTEIKLTADIDVSTDDAYFSVDGTVKLDLNNHFINVQVTGNGYPNLFSIGGNDKLTITGIGGIKPAGNDDTRDDRVWFNVEDGGELILEGGTYSGNANSVIQSAGAVTIQGSTVISNNTDDSSPILIYDGTLTVGGNSQITGNKGNDGGAIRLNGDVNKDNVLNIEGGLISGNTATRYGGAIYANGGAVVNISDGTISGNEAEEYIGGGVYINGSAMTITGGTISGNTAKQGGGIYLSDASTLTMSGGTITANVESNYGGGVYVAPGCTVEISGDAKISNNKAVTGDAKKGGGIYANNATVTITGGTISGNEADYGGGICLNSASTLTMSGGTISGNTSTSRGGGMDVDNRSTATISGNALITGNTSGNGGGLGGYDSTINLQGGTLSKNSTGGSGGAINIQGGNAQLKIGANGTEGPVIQSNQAIAYGGGVFIRTGARLVMHSGLITGNASKEREGGGLTIYYENGESSGVIYGGKITNNYAGATLDDNGEFDPYTQYGNWGGGGIYVAKGTYLYMPYSVLITDNKVGGVGGGMAGCPTGRVFIYGDNEPQIGAAIYGNSAQGVNFSIQGITTKDQDRLYARDNPVFMANGYQDYFCAFNTFISNEMFKGYANWSGSKDGKPITVEQNSDVILEATNVMGLTANPSDRPTEAAVEITGNQAYTHAGGILCDGYILLGQAETLMVTKPLMLSVEKAVEGADVSDLAGMFTFIVTNEDGETVATGTNNEEGRVDFSHALIFNQASYYENADHKVTYYVKEQIPAGGNAGVTYDAAEYKLTFTVNEATSKVVENPAIEEFNQITKTVYSINSVTVEKRSASGEEWEPLKEEIVSVENGKETITQEGNYRFNSQQNDEAEHATLHIQEAFTNTVSSSELETVSIEGEKVWLDDGKAERPESITVKLLDTLGNTVKEALVYPSPKDGRWHYSFTNLPKFDGEGKEIQYHLSEVPVNGYSVTYADDNTKIINYIPTTVSVTKVWNDENDRDGIRPTEITVYIKNGGNVVEELTLSAGADGIWQQQELIATSGELPKYDEKNQEIVYTVEEAGVSGYASEITGNATNKIITNTHKAGTVNVTGTKTWNDYNNKYGKRPASITVNLLANGVQVDSVTLTEAGDGSWTYSWNELSRYENGKEIVYTVTENPVNGYVTEISGYNITNSLVVKVPNTGDNSRLMLYAMLLAVSVALCVAIRRRSRV